MRPVLERVVTRAYWVLVSITLLRGYYTLLLGWLSLLLIYAATIFGYRWLRGSEWAFLRDLRRPWATFGTVTPGKLVVGPDALWINGTCVVRRSPHLRGFGVSSECSGAMRASTGSALSSGTGLDRYLNSWRRALHRYVGEHEMSEPRSRGMQGTAARESHRQGSVRVGHELDSRALPGPTRRVETGERRARWRLRRLHLSPPSPRCIRGSIEARPRR